MYTLAASYANNSAVFIGAAYEWLVGVARTTEGSGMSAGSADVTPLTIALTLSSQEREWGWVGCFLNLKLKDDFQV